MKLEKLKRIFTERNIDKSSYSINISPQEKSYCINEIDDKWEVFYFEKKEKSKRKVFNSESEAGTYLYDLILNDPNTMNKITIENINELKEKLNTAGVKQGDYVLGGFWDDKFSIIQNENKWEVFFSERGNKNDLKVFETEQKACEYFFNYITGFDFIMNDLKPIETSKRKGLLGKLGF